MRQTDGELSVEVAQKNRSLAALLSLGHQRDSATRDAAGAGNAVGGGSGWGGSKGAPGRARFISVGETGGDFVCLCRVGGLP